MILSNETNEFIFNFFLFLNSNIVFYSFYLFIKSYYKMKEDYTDVSYDEKMRSYEILSDTVADNKPFIVKLKGRNFRKLFAKCENYNTAMHYTVEQLMKEFHAQTVLLINDEIILIFCCNTQELFNGNCNKIQNIVGSFAAATLSLKLNTICSFYSSILNFENYEIISYLNWKHKQHRYIDIIPVFIKRQSYMDFGNKKQYKYIKFILNRIKYSEEYYNMLCSTDMNEDFLQSNKNINNYYEIAVTLN
jgi:hypothetical protein